MAKLVITGGAALSGSVRVGGAKNAAYKIMVASLLAEGSSRLLNLPKIADVSFVQEIMRGLGVTVEARGERMVEVKPEGLRSSAIAVSGESSRASTIFLPVLLTKFGEASVPLPGGDQIGRRPLERHFAGLETLGAHLEVHEGQVRATLAQKQFQGAHYRFAKNSHTGTETLLLAAVLAQGVTVLENAAVEPEVLDLVKFLKAMGGQIKLTAARTFEIKGVKQLHGAIHKIMPDRNEAVSYACAALATQGDIVVENARERDLRAFLQALTAIGAGYQVGDFGIRFYYQGPLKAAAVTTQIHPGFMTDWQPLWATLVAHAEGESTIHETVMQERFQYVPALRAMGVKLELFQPELDDPETIYNFNLSDERPGARHALRIWGPTSFNGGNFTVPDLRAGATLILAALSAAGTTTLDNIIQIDRGYEQLDERLRQLGAKISRLA